MAFLGAPIRRGEVVRQRVPVAELCDGTPVALPVMVVAGNRDGPTLYLQAGLHGDEVTGTEICRQVMAGLSPGDLAGTVVAVPVANPPAHLTRTRGFLHEERWLLDMNRLFPGAPDGLLTERLAHLLLHQFVLPADCTIDLHSALDGCIIAPFSYVAPDDDECGTLPLRESIARAFGAELIYYKSRHSKIGTSDVTRSLLNEAERAGKPMMMVEMGESRRVTQQYVPVGVRGIRNAMKVLGMLPGEPEPVPPPRRFSDIFLVHANRGGGLRMRAAVGQEVAQGQVIAEVVDVFGATVEEPVSPVDGVLLRAMWLGMINSGAEVAWIVN